MPDDQYVRLIETARRQLRDGQLDKAESACVLALAQRPADAEVQLLFASIEMRSERLGAAQQRLEKLVASVPEFPGAHYVMGEVLRLCGHDADGARAFMRGFQREFGLPRTENLVEFWGHLLEGVTEVPVEAWGHRRAEIGRFGQLMLKLGSLQPQAASLISRAREVDVCAIPAREAAFRLYALFALLAMTRRSPPEWNRFAFEELALPWLRDALRRGAFDVALSLENLIYNTYILQTETDEHFRAGFARWASEMRDGGRRFVATLPPVSSGRRGGIPRIGFFVHQVSDLAHVRLLTDVLEAHAGLPQRAFEPMVISLSSHAPAMRQRLAAAGCSTLLLEETPSWTPDVGTLAMSRLREAVAENALDALVWISNATMMPFAFGMRIAPVQIWWAMKYHGLSFEEIDGYLTGGGVSGGLKRVHDQLWRVAPIAAADWADPSLAPEAASVRARLPSHRVVYGTFGREEKLGDARFLETVARVLQSVPDSIFLWTGHERNAQIQDQLDRHGVADRCVHIGWVNTKLYAQVIDVFLDSFPFPCGYTLYESMAAERPVVLLGSAESEHTGLHALVGPLLAGNEGSAEEQRSVREIFEPQEGERLYLRCRTPQEYAAAAVRLGTDSGFRARAGAACGEFVRRFMSDRERVARIHADHLLAILAEHGRAAP